MKLSIKIISYLFITCSLYSLLVISDYLIMRLSKEKEYFKSPKEALQIRSEKVMMKNCHSRGIQFYY